MDIKILTAIIYIFVIGCAKAYEVEEKDFKPRVIFDKEKLKEKLTELQYQVTQEAALEDRRTGLYHKHFKKGTYDCIICDVKLFSSKHKFNGDIGYPTFSTPSESVAELPNRNYTDKILYCENCGSHLGSAYYGKTPWSKVKSKTGKTYIVQSASLKFTKGKP